MPVDSAWTAQIALYTPLWIEREGRLECVPGTRPYRRRVTWRALSASLTTYRPATSKAEAGAWSPGAPTGRRRCGADVEEVSCLVLDVDAEGSPGIAELAEQWECAVIVHTSHSSTPEHRRSRVVVPLLRPCPVAYWPRLWVWGQARIGGIADAQAKDPSRVYYLPATDGRPGHEAVAVERELLSLDYGVLPPTAEVLREIKNTSRNFAQYAQYSRSSASSRALDPYLYAVRRALREDSVLRGDVGVKLGGRVRADRVEGVVCPRCRRTSVYYYLAPRGYPGAMCQHRETCGWFGWLDELLESA